MSGLKARHLTPLVMAQLSSSDFTVQGGYCHIDGNTRQNILAWSGEGHPGDEGGDEVGVQHGPVHHRAVRGAAGTKQTGELEVGVDVIDLSI